jgi:ribosome maturation factor RimP
MASLSTNETIEQTVTGLGYDLVDIERTGGGLLRVTIDMPYVVEAEQFVNAEDCEKVTRQLQSTGRFGRKKNLNVLPVS